MLHHFAREKHLHRFQAEHPPYLDHCLHSTVSALQKNYGLYFSRKRVNVPNRAGSETSVMLYWLEGVSLNKARALCGLTAEEAA